MKIAPIDDYRSKKLLQDKLLYLQCMTCGEFKFEVIKRAKEEFAKLSCLNCDQVMEEYWVSEDD